MARDGQGGQAGVHGSTPDPPPQSSPLPKAFLLCALSGGAWFGGFHAAHTYGHDTWWLGWIADIGNRDPWYLYPPAHLVLGYLTAACAVRLGPRLHPLKWMGLIATVVGLEIVVWIWSATGFDSLMRLDMLDVAPKMLAMGGPAAMGTGIAAALWPGPRR